MNWIAYALEKGIGLEFTNNFLVENSRVIIFKSLNKREKFVITDELLDENEALIKLVDQVYESWN